MRTVLFRITPFDCISSGGLLRDNECDLSKLSDEQEAVQVIERTPLGAELISLKRGRVWTTSSLSTVLYVISVYLMRSEDPQHAYRPVALYPSSQSAYNALLTIPRSEEYNYNGQ